MPKSDYVIADKGYDSENIREQIRAKGSIPNILRKNNSKTANADIDWCLYKYRHLVENVFARLKHFRAIATQYDKLKRNTDIFSQSMRVMACFSNSLGIASVATGIVLNACKHNTESYITLGVGAVPPL